MINRIEFLNDHWVWPILLSAIFLLLVFIWKEWTQSGNRKFVLKLILIAVAIGSLVLIALKPAFPVENNGGEIILLTEGYSEEQLDSLKQELKGLKVVEYSPDQLIPKEVKSSEKIYLLGNGIKEYDLWQLEKAPAVHLGGLAPKGITRLKYLGERTIGDKLELEGVYSKAEEGIKLILEGPGGASLDSVSFNSEGEQKFQLAADLKVAGKYLYSLVEKDSLGKILRSDPVPVKVVEQENLRILIVNSFPTFETKYLKNFLAEAGHELVVKNKITRNRFKYEYFNTSSVPIGNLSEDVLAGFDLLLIDATSLRSLSGTELDVLENSIKKQGLGLIVQANEAYFRSGGDLDVLNFSGLQGNEVISSEWPDAKLSRASYIFEKDFALQPIHQFDGNIYSAYKRLGQGRIGTTVFNDTWQLVLDGKTKVYRELWTELFENISKRQSKSAEWEQESMIAYKNEPFNFRLSTEVAEPKIQSGTGSLIPLMQDIDFPSLWKGRTWPRETGWNTLRLDTLDTYKFYINDQSHWQSMTATNTIAANRKFFEREFTLGQGQKPLKPVDPLWFFGLFLICIGGLWLEPKL